jgi:hypothetical protein
MKLKDLAVKYSLEFLVIVLGISVSFWLNQIAVERVEEQERIKVLQSLHAELDEIDKYCRERKDNYRDDINILDALLEKGFDPDRFEGLTTSKARIEFILTRYRVFEPPMNQYQSIIHAGALKYLKSDKVNDKLGQLHNTFLRYMQTSVNYERELKQAFTPFLTTEHPEILLAKGQNATSFDEYVGMLHTAISNDKRFEANVLLLSGYLENKMYFLKLYEAILLELDGVLVEELGDDLNVTTSQERSRRR